VNRKREEFYAFKEYNKIEQKERDYFIFWVVTACTVTVWPELRLANCVPSTIVILIYSVYCYWLRLTALSYWSPRFYLC
ncbi:hypothetical protein C0J52_10910, partial [Blattella germanica]